MPARRVRRLARRGGTRPMSTGSRCQGTGRPSAVRMRPAREARGPVGPWLPGSHLGNSKVSWPSGGTGIVSATWTMCWAVLVASTWSSIWPAKGLSAGVGRGGGRGVGVGRAASAGVVRARRRSGSLRIMGGRKAFFFEKKKQKTFTPRWHWRSRYFCSTRSGRKGAGARAGGGAKVFWSFFSKKDCLPCLALRSLPHCAKTPS